MGFEELKTAITPTGAPILADDTAFADEGLADSDALNLVLQDTSAAISYLQSKGLMPTGMDNADDLVRAYVKPRQWPDGKPRANMPMFAVLEAIEKLMPQLYMAMFGSGKKRPFKLTPIGRTKPEAAKAKEAILGWAMKQAGTKEEMRRMLKTALTYGFAVGSWGWETKEHRQKVYERNAEGQISGRLETLSINQPLFECLNLKNVLVDPACQRQDVQCGARYIVKQAMVTANELDGFREDDSFKNIPTREELRYHLANRGEPTEDTLTTNKRAVWREFQAEVDSKATSVDPLESPLEYLEYWSADRVIGVLQRKIVIRNEANEFGKLPYVSCAFVDVLGSAWGFGVARLLSGEQRFQQGVVNNWIDALALVLNPVYQLLKGIGPGTQNIPVSPGKVITEAGELKPLVTPDVTGPAMTAITTSEERSAKRVGANGGSNMPDQALRTGTGVQAFSGDVVQRLQYFLELFISMVYIPVLESFIQLSAEKLTPEQVNHILTEEEGKAYQGADILDVYNAQCSVEVLAGTNLMARFAAAQLAPMIIQLVSTQPVQDSFVVQNKKFNYEEFFAETLDLMGWDVNALIIDMTPEDAQRAQTMNPQFVKGQMDQQLEAQKQQNVLQQIDQKGVQQAGVAVVRQTVKTHLDNATSALEAMQEPGTTPEGQ